MLETTAIAMSVVSIILSIITIFKRRGERKKGELKIVKNPEPSCGMNVQEYYDPNGKKVFSRHWVDIPPVDERIETCD